MEEMPAVLKKARVTARSRFELEVFPKLFERDGKRLTNMICLSGGKLLRSLFRDAMGAEEPCPYVPQSLTMSVFDSLDKPKYSIYRIDLPKPSEKGECRSLFLCVPPDGHDDLPSFCVVLVETGKKFGQLFLWDEGQMKPVKADHRSEFGEMQEIRDLCSHRGVRKEDRQAGKGRRGSRQKTGEKGRDSAEEIPAKYPTMGNILPFRMPR